MKGLVLTKKGKKALGINDAESNRHGGPEHRYWVKAVADHLRTNGYNVAKEVPIRGGKTIDLVATRRGEQIAFEIETGKSDAVANVRKCLKTGMDSIIVVATSAKIKRQLDRCIVPDNRVKIVAGPSILNGALPARCER